MKKTYLLFLLSYFICQSLFAQEADAIRGGWIADINGVRHVYVLVVDGETVTGVYCSIDCSNPDNLAFVDDGLLNEDGLSFNLYHDSGSGEVKQYSIEAELRDGNLHLIQHGDNPDSEEIAMVFQRSPVAIVPAAPSGGFVPATVAYEPPAPLENINIEKVLGLWLAGTGPNKQHFMFKRHKNGLRGMVCGPCEDGSGMAPLEGIRLQGSNLYFDIVHENTGPGMDEYGPHKNITRATVSKNEMHIWVIPSFEDPAIYQLIEMTMLGPTNYQAR